MKETEYNWQDVDEVTTSLMKSLAEAEAPLRKQQHKGLVTALARYGYTEQEMVQVADFFRDEYYYRDSTEGVVCNEVKPYRLFWQDGAFVIVHGDCHDYSHEHAQEFLQEMIPIIGKLDAKAEFDPGEKYAYGPRLRICMEMNRDARIETK